MYSKEKIENLIINAVKDVTGITDICIKDSLVDKKIHIIPVDFLYIFDILSKTLNIDVTRVLKTNNHNIMVVENLALAILALEQRNYV